MSYPNNGPAPLKHAASTYSTSSSDPFNPSVQQLPYDQHAPYGGGGGHPIGAGPGGNAQSGQYTQYGDNEREMRDRMDGGGMARETWATESGFSRDGECSFIALDVMTVVGRWNGRSSGLLRFVVLR